MRLIGPQGPRSRSGEPARFEIERGAFCPVGHTYGDGFQDTHQGDNVVRLALLLDADVYAVFRSLER